MNRLILAKFLLFLLISMPTFGQSEHDKTVRSGVTANPNSSGAAKALLKFIAKLPEQKNKRVLSGQYGGWPNETKIKYNAFDTALLGEVYKTTGKYPAILGADLYGKHNNNISECRVFSCNNNQDLINHWNAGGLVNINLHPYRPDMHNTSKCGMRSGGNGGYDLKRLLPGGEDHKNWREMLDEAADCLKQLQNAGVVILFRPLHEMDGTWFWWCSQDPTAYREVWKDMFNYLTYNKKLNNLIWVWGASYNATTLYYPGSQYVDIVGFDNYNDNAGSIAVEKYNNILALNKPFSYQEFGSGSGSTGASPNYDFRNLIISIKEKYPATTYFLVWSEAYRISNPQHNHQYELMNDPWLINRGDIKIKLFKNKFKRN